MYYHFRYFNEEKKKFVYSNNMDMISFWEKVKKDKIEHSAIEVCISKCGEEYKYYDLLFLRMLVKSKKI